MAALLFKAGN